jgi:ATP-dependent 26S proteasome regulatory subunit
MSSIRIPPFELTMLDSSALRGTCIEKRTPALPKRSTGRVARTVMELAVDLDLAEAILGACVFRPVDLDNILVPAGNLDRAIETFERHRAARAKRIAVVKIFAIPAQSTDVDIDTTREQQTKAKQESAHQERPH